VDVKCDQIGSFVPKSRLPFGGKLSADNRWIKLADLIPWDELEDDCAAQFCKGVGAPARPFRMVLGALIVKTCLGLTDEELAEQIKENPYLQFFLGLESFQYLAPVDPSLIVHFRKRLPESVVNACNDRIVRHGLNVIRSSDSSDQEDNSSRNVSTTDGEQHEPSTKTQPNQGYLLIDATCVPVDIRHLLVVAKEKRPWISNIRRAIKQQLGYLKRNLASIDALIECRGSLLVAGRDIYRKLLVVSKLFCLQNVLYHVDTRSIPDQIVSLCQADIRPIVRGKARCNVEFGAKPSISVTGDGFTFLDRLSFDPNNEGEDLNAQARAYRRHYSH